MGACASRLSSAPQAAVYGEPFVPSADGDYAARSARPHAPAHQALVSRRYLRTAPGEAGSTAEKIATAFIQQAAANGAQSSTSLRASLTSRRSLPDTTARGPAPAAESLANAHSAVSDAATAAVAASSLDWKGAERPPEPSDDSFEQARAAAYRHLAHMTRSCRSSTAAATAWPAPRPPVDTGTGSHADTVHISEDSYDPIVDGNNANTDGNAVSGGAGGGGGVLGRGDAQEAEAPPAAAEVEPVGQDVGAARNSMEELQCAGGGRQADRCARRTGSATTVGGLPGGDPVPEVAGPSLPGSLHDPGAGCERGSDWAGGQPRTGPRLSEVSYVQQQLLLQQSGHQTAPEGGAIARLKAQSGRNSDNGFYFEEARLGTPGRGAAPVRHSLLDTPLARQLEARDAAGAPVHKPSTLDYVPKLRTQPSRGNLLQPQPSQRQRQAGGLPDAPSEDSDAAPAARLEYTPSRTMSRRHVNASRFGPAASAASSPLAARAAGDPRVDAGTAFGSQLTFDGPTNPRDRDDSSARSLSLAARPAPLSVDVTQRRVVVCGPLSPVSGAQTEHRPGALLLSGALSATATTNTPRAATASASHLSESLRTAAWNDISAQGAAAVCAGRAAASCSSVNSCPGAGGGGGALAAALAGVEGTLGGASRPSDRTSRLVASLHRLGVSPAYPSPGAAAPASVVAPGTAFG